MSSPRQNQSRYVATLAAIAGAILIVGYLLKPSEVPEPTISQAETSRLRRISQRANLENLTSYFSDIAASVEGSAVWVNEIGINGLIWNQDGLVIVPGPVGSRDGVTALTVGGAIPLETLADRSSDAIAAFQAPLTFGLQTPVRRVVGSISSGAWVIQVVRQPEGGYRFTQATYGGIATSTCGDNTIYRTIQSSLPLNEATLGAGIFDIDNNLLGMVIRCGDGFAAITADSIDQTLERARTAGSRLSRFYGIIASELNATATTYFRASSGVWINSVTTGITPNALQPGDVIVSIGGQPVTTLEDLEPMLDPTAAPFSLELVRDRETIQVTIRAFPESPQPPPPTVQNDGTGILLSAQPTAPGFAVQEIIPGSPSARAGMEPGDRILTINRQTPRNQAAAQQALNTLDDTVGFLVYQRDNVRTGVLLP